jgi:hypothetical protein
LPLFNEYSMEKSSAVMANFLPLEPNKVDGRWGAASDVDSGAVVSGRRTTRRMNAWQQQQQQLVEGNWF